MSRCVTSANLNPTQIRLSTSTDQPRKEPTVADADLLDLINDELNPVEVPFPSEVPALEAPASQVPASDVVKDELAGGSQAIHNDISSDGDNNDGEESDDPAELPDSLHEYDSITKFSLF